MDYPVNWFRYGFTFIPKGLIFEEEITEPVAELLRQYKTGWVLIEAPRTRAIPENFIRTFSDQGIQIVIDLNIPPNEEFSISEFEPMIKAYANWGARYVIATKFPNDVKETGGNFWVKKDPLTFAIENFIRLAKACSETAIRPIFPLLSPKGSYWDIAFLENALTELVSLKEKTLLNRMVLAAPAYTYGKNLDWGAGETANRSQIPQEENSGVDQDQVGFHRYEWYQEIALKILGRTLPCIMFEAGKECPHTEDIDPVIIQKIIRIASGENVEIFPENNNSSELHVPISQDIVGCILGFNIFRLFTESNMPGSLEEKIQVKIIEWLEQIDEIETSNQLEIDKEKMYEPFSLATKRVILLPEKEAVRDKTWKKGLDNYLKRYPSKIVYSTSEARQAVHVLVLGDEDQFTEESLEELRTFGAHVRRVPPQRILKLL